MSALWTKVEGTLLGLVERESHVHTKKLLRVVLLSWVLVYTLLLLPAHADFWGEDTFGARFEFDGSPWRLLTLPAVASHYRLFLLGQVASLVLAIAGVMPRLTVFLAFFFTRNLMSGVDVTLDGGNNLSELIFVYLLFMDTSGRDRGPATGFWRCLLVGLSNAAFLVARLQLVAVYLVAGFCKVLGPMWQEGTALYYIFQHHRFGHPAIAPLVLRYPMITVLGSYFTIAFQLAFPVLIWRRGARPYLFAAGAFLHLGIAVVMGLLSFGLFMVSIYVVFFADAWSARVLAVGTPRSCNEPSMAVR